MNTTLVVMAAGMASRYGGNKQITGMGPNNEILLEYSVCDAIRAAVPTARKVVASRSKKEASFLTEEAVDTDSLKTAIDATGYTCLDIASAPYEKKGLFGWF